MRGGVRDFGGGLEGRVAELERRLRVNSVTALEARITTVEGRTDNGQIVGTGTFSLTADGVATSTVVTDATVSTTSRLFLTPTNAGGWSVDAGLTGIAKASGSFTVSHSASTLARSFEYLVVNPA